MTLSSFDMFHIYLKKYIRRLSPLLKGLLGKLQLISVNIMELFASVIQVRGYACYDIRLNLQFHEEMPVPSREYDSSFSFI